MKTWHPASRLESGLTRAKDHGARSPHEADDATTLAAAACGNLRVLPRAGFDAGRSAASDYCCGRQRLA